MEFGTRTTEDGNLLMIIGADLYWLEQDEMALVRQLHGNMATTLSQIGRRGLLIKDSSKGLGKKWA